uniref:class I adenylate-forming enzyme family protein n=1 Tax=Stappia sp. TaxID=1870903 RepID=UPI003BABC913
MTSIDTWIEAHAQASPDKAAIVFAGETLTYGDLAGAVGRIARHLRDNEGVLPGERVAYLGTNAPDMLALLFACARLGAILVPLNWRLAPPELAHAVADCGARLLLHHPEYAETAAVITGDAGARLVDPAQGGLIAQTAGLDALGPGSGEGHGEVPLLIVYTSGTTGRPKGAVLTQDALAANADNACHMQDITAADRVLTVLPMFHVGGLNIQTTPALREGATVILHDRFHPAATLAALREERPTLTVLVPATLAAVIAHPDWSRADLASLRLVATGSSDVPHSLMKPFIERDVPVLQVYGATETGPVSIYQRVGDAAAEFGSIGRAGPRTRVRLMADGREAGTGEIGEIQLMGGNITRGYWGREDATAESFADGWFRTGDLAMRDADGVYWFKDRIKNVIISGGENIYPAELERVLREIEIVGEAAVVGVADPRWGESPVAVVVPKAGEAVDETGVLAGFNGRLARYKHPKSVVMVEELPRNALGKIKLDMLRKIAEDALGARDATGRDPVKDPKKA